MADPNEIAALKASFRGALSTAGSLQTLQAKVDGIDASGDIPPELLDELAKITVAHSIASAALRGLVVTMLTRRGAGTP